MYLPNLTTLAGYGTRSIFKRCLTGLNWEISNSYTDCYTKVKEPSLSYYLPIAGGRIVGFLPFARILAFRVMQAASSRIRTRVTISIFLSRLPLHHEHYMKNCSKVYISTYAKWFFLLENQRTRNLMPTDISFQKPSPVICIQESK